MRSRTTDVIQQFAEWLSQTSLSILIQTHNAWVIPTIQSIHIIAIGVVLTSVLMIDLRILGRAGRDQTLRATTDRFGPWLSGALLVLLITGVSMVVGEPVRALLSFSFWLKMFFVAVGRSEEHTSELQSRLHLVCRLLLEKKKKTAVTK